MQKKYHLCQSIAGLEALMEQEEPINWLLTNGRIATYEEIEAAIKDAKAKGYEVLPSCDNVTPTGHCAGHDVPPNRIASCKRGFERTVPVPADWTEMPILVMPPEGDPFFPECKDCEVCRHGEDCIAIMPDDADVFHRVKLCLLTFRDVEAVS